MTRPAATMRIGELAARTGVSVHVLRVWERRYGLLTPIRSTGGYRLYGPSDERRVLETVRLRDTGMPTGQAAAVALSASRQTEGAGPTEVGRDAGDDAVMSAQAERLRQRLLQAVETYDDTAAHAALDATFEKVGVEDGLRDVVLPVLRETGERWATGTFTVAQEHFVSHVIRSRLAALTLAWDGGSGPLAVLACAPGEQHDLGLLAFGVIIGRTGWRVRYLGADTPLETLWSAVESLTPDLVVLTAVRAGPFDTAATQLEQLPDTARRTFTATHLVVAGAGATRRVAERLGADLLDGDPIAAALDVAPR